MVNKKIFVIAALFFAIFLLFLPVQAAATPQIINVNIINSTTITYQTGRTLSVNYTYSNFTAPRNATIQLYNSSGSLVGTSYLNVSAMATAGVALLERTDTFTISAGLPDGYYRVNVTIVNGTVSISNLTTNYLGVDNTPPAFYTNAYILPSITTATNITTLSFSLSVNVSEQIFNASNVQAVWYYFSTSGYSNSANASMSNVTTTQKILNATFNQTVPLQFGTNYTGPGQHTVTFCANDTAGNKNCSAAATFIVRVANITQIRDHIRVNSGVTANITYENGTGVSNDLMHPALFNYSLRINATITTFVEIVGMTINETLMAQIANTTQNSTITSQVRSAVSSLGFNTTDFIWYDVDSFLPAATFYKYGRMQLPAQYHAVFYCNGTDALSASCAKINPCSAAVNRTNYGTGIIPADGGCYNNTEVSGKTVIYVDHFSGGAGGNDTIPPDVAIVTPANATWYKTNFTINATITDGIGVNVSRVYYQYENDTYNSSWIQMTNVSASNWNATVDISAMPDGNYTFRINVTDLAGNLNATVAVTSVMIDDTAPTISSFTLTPSSVTTNNAIEDDCSCSDNSEDFGGSVQSVVTGLDVSTTGTKTATCTATDTAGNTAATTATYTVSLQTSTGGTTGSSGTGAGTSGSVIFPVVNPGAPQVFKGFGAAVSISEIELAVKTQVTSAKITVQMLANKPGTITDMPAGDVYKYMSISAPVITPDKIETAKIKFAVPKLWIINNSIDKDTVALNRYYNATWSRLTTNFASENASNLYYEAETPGFSTFVVTGEKLAEGATQEVTAPAEEAKSAEEIKKAVTMPEISPKAAGILILLIVIIIGLYWYKLKSGKRKVRKY